MKSRLSLTVDPQVTHRAKRVARARNQSLSSMVEDLLRQAAETDLPPKAAATPTETFSKRWGGTLELAAADAFGAQLIATRNLKHYRKSPIQAREPEEVLSLLKGQT
jgi:hypothetical protein